MARKKMNSPQEDGRNKKQRPSYSGYDQNGFLRNGIHRNGTNYDDYGYDMWGFNQDGYNREGYDREGYSRQGYNKKGYNKAGYDRNGYNKKGFNKEGYDQYGYDRAGKRRKGNMLGINDTTIEQKNSLEKLESIQKSNRTIKSGSRQDTDQADENEMNKEFEEMPNLKDKDYNVKLLTQQMKITSRSMNSRDYTGALNHLRVGAEVFCLVILLHHKVPYNKYIDLDQCDRLRLVGDLGLLDKDDIGVLQEIRVAGNKCIHPEVESTGYRVNVMTEYDAYKYLNHLYKKCKNIVMGWKNQYYI